MPAELCATEPILCAGLLPKLDAKLIELLRSLGPEEWNLKTVAPRWKVRHVAAHLLDTCLRKLSMVRDSHHAEAVDIRSSQDLVLFVNRLNHEGVTVYRRLSRRLLIETMRSRAAKAHFFTNRRSVRSRRFRFTRNGSPARGVGGTWLLTRRPEGWQFATEWLRKPWCRVVIPEHLAWRIFTKGVDRNTVRDVVEIEGTRDLGEKILTLPAIVG